MVDSYGNISFTHRCAACDAVIATRKQLGIHISKCHSDIEGIKGYVEKYFSLRQPECLCGCGQLTLWHKTKYCYNRYITGHNNKSTATRCSPSQDAVKKRNAAIRAAYAEHGDEIKRKIALSVKDAFSNPDVSRRHAAAVSASLNADGMHEKLSSIRKRVWAEQRSELMSKIFTDEMRSKISSSNMTREVSKSSFAEQKFIEHAKTFDHDAKTQVWKSIDGMTACYDMQLSCGTYVEFDGTYWHGLDRSSDWSDQQLATMTSDLRKLRSAVLTRSSYIKIAEDADWCSCRDYESLLACAHTAVIDGKIIKNGLPSIDDETIITRASRVVEVQQQTVRCLLNYLKQYAETYGWIYPVRSSSFADAIAELANSRKYSHAGSAYLQSIFRSYWDTNDGPRNAFYNDAVLSNVLRTRLAQGIDITFRSIRRGLRVQKKAVSWFRPAYAKYIYSKYCTAECPTVWDPSAGFGARMLGFVSSFSGGTYICNEPSSRTRADLSNLASDIVSYGYDIIINSAGSEMMAPDECTVDFVFTSPPYYDTEKYYDESGQAWKEYKTYQEWVDSYVKPTVKHAYVCLKQNSKFVINVSNKYADVFNAVAVDVGFKHVCTEQMSCGNSYMGNGSVRTEPVIVYAK